MEGAAEARTENPSFDLVRLAVRPAGAFGALLHDGLPFAFTLERTYTQSDGVQHVKIPPGLHQCRSSYFHRGAYNTYEIRVRGHSRILFHRGNVEGDSEGCILLGRRRGELKGKPAVLESRLAFEDFMRRTGGVESFLLLVREA